MENSSALYDADNLDEKLQEAAQQVAAGQFAEGEALAKKVLESVNGDLAEAIMELSE